MSKGNFERPISSNATLILDSKAAGLCWWSKNQGYHNGRTESDIISEVRRWSQTERKTSEFRDSMNTLLSAQDLSITVR